MSACPNCGSKDTSVVRSDVQPDGTMKRRRKCKKEFCQLRFDTIELAAQKLSALQKLSEAISSVKKVILG